MIIVIISYIIGIAVTAFLCGKMSVDDDISPLLAAFWPLTAVVFVFTRFCRLFYMLGDR